MRRWRPEPAVDAQTTETEATGVATAESSDDVAVASADTSVDDAMAVGDNDDVAVATADDAEVLMVQRAPEHISTY